MSYLAELYELYPDWQHVKLTRIGYAEQRAKALVEIDKYIQGKVAAAKKTGKKR